MSTTYTEPQPPPELPQEQQHALEKVVRLESISIIYLITAVSAMAATMGNSEAMKNAWVDDLISFAPPIVFLLSERIRKLRPNKKFPYGYNRIISIGYFTVAVSMTLLGIYLFTDAAMKLIESEKPSIGTSSIFGKTVWSGWLMIAASIWSGLPAAILGHFKKGPALKIHNKLAYADTAMERANWMVAVATVVGIIGIGFGWWWLDGAAAIFISLEVIRDGASNIKSAVSDLIDEVPTTLETVKVDPIIERVNDYFKGADWVEKSTVSLREDGHLFTGDAYVVPKSENGLVTRIEASLRDLRAIDWRLKNVTITPVREREFETHLV